MGLKLQILDPALTPIAGFDLVQGNGIILPHPEYEPLEKKFQLIAD
ncbi:hypothetical protein [Desulforhabdus sp. TSK]|nr:hypothetical protein [Desulforhabdus sp. TSK]GKT09157.1 hypothetical protein DSTSK_24620 [Desulforhabdus sp. TSK]